VIVAGSTGSIPATAALIAAVVQDRLRVGVGDVLAVAARVDRPPAVRVEAEVEARSDPVARGRELMLAEAARLRRDRPADPVIVAGSTGSIPATAALIPGSPATPRRRCARSRG
jgi:inactivated superfamily I helicase